MVDQKSLIWCRVFEAVKFLDVLVESLDCRILESRMSLTSYCVVDAVDVVDIQVQLCEKQTSGMEGV